MERAMPKARNPQGTTSRGHRASVRTDVILLRSKRIAASYIRNAGLHPSRDDVRAMIYTLALILDHYTPKEGTFSS